MARKAKELTALAVSKLARPGLHFVGGVSGLALQVLPSGGRTWILRATIAGKRRDMGLGGFPEVSLAEARASAQQARAVIRQGKDPIDEARATRSALQANRASAVTFDQAAEAYLAAHQAGWRNAKHAMQWRSTLATYASPVIGKLLVRDIVLAHVLSILEPIWSNKTETASRLRGRIESVLGWATTRGYREGLNPARWKGNLDTLLARPSKVSKTHHHTALPVKAAPAFVKQLRKATGTGARALEFLILTAARSGEVRGARWSELDLDEAVWKIPAGRMKAGREHRVPLSDEALALLARLPRIEGTDLVFPSARHGELSDMTLTGVLRRMDVPAVPHGFRSTFRDWCSEHTEYPNEAAEIALAHAVSNKVEAAYRRGDLFEKRRLMMRDWACFCYGG